MAVVREKGYTHWDGRLVERRFPWTPITRTGIRLAFRKKGFKFAFAGTFVPSFFALGGLYVSERLEDFKALVQSNRALLRIDPGYFKVVFTNNFLLFLLLLVLSFGTAGLVSDDLKHSSLQLYFARPLGKKDYIIGKMAVVAFFVILATALPGLLLVIFKLIFAGSFAFLGAYPWLPFSILGYSAVLTVFFGCYVLLLSASSRNTRYAIVLIFGVYYFSAVLAAMLKGIFRTPYMSLFSIPANIGQAGAALFGQKLPMPLPAAWSFAVLAAVCLLAAAVLDRKARSVEVIK
jgi:ABC-type transport system involved in multi-copper enzyme maturation permease subunit